MIFEARVPWIVGRVYPLSEDDMVIYWTRIAEEAEEDRSEDEARINMQASGENQIEDQVRVKGGRGRANL
jgi:hypothetical protein